MVGWAGRPQQTSLASAAAVVARCTTLQSVPGGGALHCSPSLLILPAERCYRISTAAGKNYLKRIGRHFFRYYNLIAHGRKKRSFITSIRNCDVVFVLFIVVSFAIQLKGFNLILRFYRD